MDDLNMPLMLMLVGAVWYAWYWTKKTRGKDD